MVQLTPTAQKFIVHWGEMGERWGINRTVGQIHALLYMSPEPLNAEQICEILSLARSTVSVGLHELETWGIIRVVHVLGDRTDHFEVKGDVYEMFRGIVDYRKRHEIDPTLGMLRETVAEQNGDDPHSQKKLEEMLDFFETIDSIYQQAQRVPTKTIVRFGKMGDLVSKVLKFFPDS
jgi:DNA-binding transcriptional regulator GbsR (MarR family)